MFCHFLVKISLRPKLKSSSEKFNFCNQLATCGKGWNSEKRPFAIASKPQTFRRSGCGSSRNDAAHRTVCFGIASICEHDLFATENNFGMLCRNAKVGASELDGSIGTKHRSVDTNESRSHNRDDRYPPGRDVRFGSVRSRVFDSNTGAFFGQLERTQNHTYFWRLNCRAVGSSLKAQSRYRHDLTKKKKY